MRVIMYPRDLCQGRYHRVVSGAAAAALLQALQSEGPMDS